MFYEASHLTYFSYFIFIAWTSPMRVSTDKNHSFDRKIFQCICIIIISTKDPRTDLYLTHSKQLKSICAYFNKCIFYILENFVCFRLYAKSVYISCFRCSCKLQHRHHKRRTHILSVQINLFLRLLASLVCATIL